MQQWSRGLNQEKRVRPDEGLHGSEEYKEQGSAVE